jgi:hypothetical protein
MKRIVWFCLCAAMAMTAMAQSVHFGVKGGIALRDDLSRSSATSESKRYVVGPMVVLGLPHGFSLEFDALYRRVGYRTSDSFAGLVSSNERFRGNSWEFPILLRKSL